MKSGPDRTLPHARKQISPSPTVATAPPSGRSTCVRTEARRREPEPSTAHARCSARSPQACSGAKVDSVVSKRATRPHASNNRPCAGAERGERRLRVSEARANAPASHATDRIPVTPPHNTAARTTAATSALLAARVTGPDPRRRGTLRSRRRPRHAPRPASPNATREKRRDAGCASR